MTHRRNAREGSNTRGSGPAAPHSNDHPTPAPGSHSFPVLTTGTHLHLTPTCSWLLYEVSDSPHWNWGIMRVDHDMVPVLMACDGRTPLGDVAQRARASARGAARDAVAFLESLSFRGIVSFADTPTSAGAFPSLGGSRDYHVPLHVFLELTDRCNLRCAHCYRDARPERGSTMPIELLVELIDRLAREGTLVCELTGGEPTLHPAFERVVSRCADRFELMSLITNGLRVDDRLASLLADARRTCTVLVSVTLNSHDPEFHDRFVGRSGAFEAACEAVQLLVSANVMVRVTMNVVPGNLAHLEATADLAVALGADAFAPAFVMPFGRGASIDWSTVTAEELLAYERAYARIRRKYPWHVLSLPEAAFDTIEAPNCGAGSRSVVIDPRGNVRPCVTIPPEFSMGNAFADRFEECFNACEIAALESLAAPTEAVCGGCRFEGFCARCFWRALVARSRSGACRWPAGEPLSPELDRLVATAATCACSLDTVLRHACS